MAIDYTSLCVPEKRFQQCLKVYLEALKPLGYEIRHQFGEFVVGLGSRKEDLESYRRADFSVFGTKSVHERAAHIAFSCQDIHIPIGGCTYDYENLEDHASVDAYYAAAIKAGAKDNGAPGLRPFYHPNYYGAFVLDPAGNNAGIASELAGHRKN